MRRVKTAAPLTPEEAARLFTSPGPPVERVVLAVSGGPDSIAMSGLYAEAARRFPLPAATVATVDHGLRPSAAEEAAAVADFAATLGLPHHTLVWTGRKPATGIQVAARKARYRLLTQLACDIDAQAILIAHTLDDQAETVLMRLMRGSGIKGLGGMDVVSPSGGPMIFRPLLEVPKARLLATCTANGWSFALDPSNTAPQFLRTRLRALAPRLAEEGLTAERLGKLAARMRRADETLDSHALGVMESCRIWKRGATLYDAARLAAESEEIVTRVFAHVIALGRDGSDDPYVARLERIEALAVDFRRAVTDNLTFRRNTGGILFTLSKGVLSLRAEPERRARRLISSNDKIAPMLGKPATDA